VTRVQRALLIRSGILILPFVLIFAGARVAGPAFADWKKVRLLGADYERHEVAGAGGGYDVWLAKRRGPDDARRAAAAVSQFMTAACAPAAGFDLEAPDKPVRIVLFDERRTLEAYAGISFNKLLHNNGGFYHPMTREIGLLWDERQSFEGLARDLKHEATHLLFDLASARGLSPWLAEGLACHFEYADRPGAADLRYRPTAQTLIETGQPLGLRQVLDAEQDAFLADDNERYYAVSAALVTFCLDGGDAALRKGFLEHLARQKAGGARGAGALEAALDVGIEELETRLAAWINGK
jgi:hypothetical protein